MFVSEGSALCQSLRGATALDIAFYSGGTYLTVNENCQMGETNHLGLNGGINLSGFTTLTGEGREGVVTNV